jgi:hypothetical protein
MVILAPLTLAPLSLRSVASKVGVQLPAGSFAVVSNVTPRDHLSPLPASCISRVIPATWRRTQDGARLSAFL